MRVRARKRWWGRISRRPNLPVTPEPERLIVGLLHPPLSYSGAVGVLGWDTYAGGGGESREPELAVEEELEVVTRTATGLVLNDRVRGRTSGSGSGRHPPPPPTAGIQPLDPIPPGPMMPD
jgi:hypothetical protein